MDFHRSISDRLFSLLALAWPLSFRRQFGEDMAATFRARLAEVRAEGPAAVRRFWLRTTRETLALGLAARWGTPSEGPEATRAEPSRQPRGAGRGAGNDLRQALRMLARDPGTAFVAVVALALGIGVTVATFSITHATVLRGLPFEEADALVHFERSDLEAGVTTLAVTPHDFVAWREQQRSFEDLGAYVESVAHMTGSDGFTERLSGVAIDPAAFRLLRVEPALGRLFTAEEARVGGPEAMVLSHALWQGRFGGDSALVGQSLALNGEPVTIIGVMPAGFGFPVAEQFWRPLRIDLARTPRGQGRLDVFGRLRAGTTLDAARGEFAVISAGLAEAYPETNRGLSANLSSFRDEYVGEEFTRLVYTMLAGSILVLLIACANVTNLLIARGASRSRDVGVRMALGASRGQVVRQFLVEGAVLAGIGAVGGVAIGAIGISWFEAGARAGVFTLPHGSDSLFWWDIRLNAVSVLFAVGATGIAALCAGLVPALSTLRAAPAVALRDASRGSTSRPTARLSRALVVVEFALTTGLALAAGLTVRSVLNVTGVADAFRSEGIRTGRAALPLAQAGFSEAAYPDHASRLLFAERLLAETRAQPGVTLAAVANVLPNEPGPSTSLAVAGVVPESGAGSSVRVATVSDDYFAVFGVVPLEGRTFTAADRAGGEPVAMINRSLAERHFGGRSPLHERIRLGEDGDEPWLTIVGVVPDLWAHDDPARDLSRVFVPLAQSGTADPTIRLGRWGLRFLTLAAAGGETVLPPPAVFRSAAAAIDPAIPVYAEQPMAEVVALRTARFRLFGRYYLAFGAVALSLAVIGLYGVMAGSVARRRSEFGIRMALGAGRQVVLGEVMGQALRQVAAGLALGGVVAWWLASGLRAALFRVELVDPPVLLGVPLLLVLTGVLAGLLPALRASRVNPTDAIRSN